MHDDMLSNLMKAPLSLFYTKISKETILNRFAVDHHRLEYLGYMQMSNLFSDSFDLFGTLFLTTYYMSISLLFFFFIVICLSIILHFKINTSRDQTRINMIMTTGIISSLSESIEGSQSIKVFGIQAYQSTKIYRKLDDFYKNNRFFYNTNIFFYFLNDLFSWSFYVFLYVYCGIYKEFFKDVAVGLLISNAGNLQTRIRDLWSNIGNLFFLSINVDRCLQYCRLEKENEKGLEPTNWPTKGRIELVNYSTAYPGGTNVLKNLSFSINSGTRTAIVGRSGSGKSTFCSAILRVLEATEGSILIDGVDIKKVNLRILRRNISVIPQNPLVMKGTLRFNIDMTGIYSDEEIMSMIELIGMKNFIEDKGGLDMIVSD